MNERAATVQVDAKLNLSLLITGKSGGFHTLDMVAASVDAFRDTVTVSRREDAAVRFSASVPLPERNTAVRAALAFQKAYGTPGVDVRIEKGIPFEAGLGGSSADAAGVLRCMQRLFGARPAGEVEELALSVGSDVPYMLYGGWARVTGTGERLAPFRVPAPLHFVVARPAGGVSTARAFALFDEAEENGGRGDNGALVELLAAGRVKEAAGYLVNDLYPAACKLEPEVALLARAIRATGAAAVSMTGAGSALFGLYKSAGEAAAAEAALKGSAAVVRAGKTTEREEEI